MDGYDIPALARLGVSGVQARTWTSFDKAKTFEGDLEFYTPSTGKVIVKQIAGNGMTLTFHPDTLCAADIAFLKEHARKDAGSMTASKSGIGKSSRLFACGPWPPWPAWPT